jgi:signal recognition particle receptor subunit beta
MAGKSTCLHHLHRSLRVETRGQMISVTTGTDQTIFFDFFPAPSPRLPASALRVALYTTPGEARNASTHRSLLEGVAGIVFVADSQRARRADNVAALERLRAGLLDLGLRLEGIPHLFLWNKRDLPDVLPEEELGALLNPGRAPALGAVAVTGRGVFDSLKGITGALISDLLRRRPRPSSAPGGSNGSGPRRGPDSSPSLSGLLPLSPATEPEEKESSAEITVIEEHEVRGPQPRRGSLPPQPARRAEVRRPAAATFLQPLSPESLPFLPDGKHRGMALLLPPGHIREQVQQIEAELIADQPAQAIRQAAALFEEITADMAPSEAEEGRAVRALALGVSLQRYRRFREAIRNAALGAATLEDAYFALFFILDATVRR